MDRSSPAGLIPSSVGSPYSSNINKFVSRVKGYTAPAGDEPEPGVVFQRQMSINGKLTGVRHWLSREWIRVKGYDAIPRRRGLPACGSLDPPP